LIDQYKYFIFDFAINWGVSNFKVFNHTSNTISKWQSGSGSFSYHTN
jgi:hypothetical protein